MKRSVAVLVMSSVLVGLTAGLALAWQCPVQWRAAEDAIKKAEALSLPPEAKALVAQAEQLVAESKKHHNEGNAKIDHANSMWKARAALAQAEAAAILATP
jgi:hypothetical protein